MANLTFASRRVASRRVASLGEARRGEADEDNFLVRFGSVVVFNRLGTAQSRNVSVTVGNLPAVLQPAVAV